MREGVLLDFLLFDIAQLEIHYDAFIHTVPGNQHLHAERSLLGITGLLDDQIELAFQVFGNLALQGDFQFPLLDHGMKLEQFGEKGGIVEKMINGIAIF